MRKIASFLPSLFFEISLSSLIIDKRKYFNFSSIAWLQSVAAKATTIKMILDGVQDVHEGSFFIIDLKCTESQPRKLNE